jgi:peptidoglycan hydrolase-like protein with peptidoglycan-binding domain
MGLAYDGVTDGDGVLEEDIPEDADAGTLNLFAPPDKQPAGSNPPPDAGELKPKVLWSLPLTIANMAPAADIAGAQKRLNNLGFFAGVEATGELDPQTKRALLRFQTLYKLNQYNPSGILDADTIKKLQDIYGS